VDGGLFAFAGTGEQSTERRGRDLYHPDELIATLADWIDRNCPNP
jgi:hypothetical protein